MKMRLTESQLHRIISETVRRVVNEIGETPRGQYALGQVQARADLRAIKAEYDLERAEKEGDYSNYDKHFNDRNKYKQTAYDAAVHSYNKWNDRSNEEVGLEKKFRTPEDKEKYLNAMGDAKSRGYRDYNVKHDPYYKNKSI